MQGSSPDGAMSCRTLGDFHISAHPSVFPMRPCKISLKKFETNLAKKIELDNEIRIGQKNSSWAKKIESGKKKLNRAKKFESGKKI